MRKNVLRTAIILISAAVMVYAAHRIYQEHSEYREGADSYSALEAYIKEPQTEPMPEESKPDPNEMSENAIAWPVVDFAALESINSDCVAWIRIDGTEIDYPVVQGHDNSFFLKHLFDGEWNGAGCIFLDSRVNPDLSDRHSVLYGHHMKNPDATSGAGRKAQFVRQQKHGLPDRWRKGRQQACKGTPARCEDSDGTGI